MEWVIRKSIPQELESIQDVVLRAFEHKPFSDQTEHLLVQRLMQTDSFIPSLSLVAVIGEEIIGYILLTKIRIDLGTRLVHSLSLAPVAVAPPHQGKGVGSNLILRAHELAAAANHKSIILVGNPEYYSRFGYTRCDNFDISLPFDIPAKNCLAIELTPKALSNVTGMVVYPKAFFM